MLEIAHLHKTFDGLKAVDDFSLSLRPNQITSLIGPNGAGKTTVFNIATGFLSPSMGSVVFENTTLVDLPPWKIARWGISRTFQNLRLFKRMSVLENVLLGRQEQSGESWLNALFRFNNESHEHVNHLKHVKDLLDFVGLADDSGRLAENLSYGQQKLLSIACALAMEPKLLLLDEPVSGVQPAMIEKIESVLKTLVKKGTTIFLIEHDIEFVLRNSDSVIVMDEGRKIAEDKPSAIRDNPEILEAYLS